MNIWDIAILIAVACAVYFGVRRARRNKGGCGCGCGCEGCRGCDRGAGSKP